MDGADEVFESPKKRKRQKTLDFGNSQSVWSERIGFQPPSPTVGQVYLSQNRPLTTQQEKKFWKIVATAINGNVSERSLAKVVANTWNEYHFTTMSKNGIGFGGRISEHHASKILKRKGQHLRLQQHFQLKDQKPSPVAQKKTQQHFQLSNSKPPPVVNKKPVLEREDLAYMSYKQMRDWIGFFGLSHQSSKKKQIAALMNHLDQLEKKNK